MLLDVHGTTEGISLEVTKKFSTLDDNGPIPWCFPLKNL